MIAGYITGHRSGPRKMNSSQNNAVAAHRHRLGERGLARYEVRGLRRDKELVRAFARRLVMDDAGAARLRDDVARGVEKKPLSGRQIWLALRESPLVGLDLETEREVTEGRDIAL
jgi:hypothetical protein